jgi:colanic acid/amylovoran biosynthesis glycosyltransferase
MRMAYVSPGELDGRAIEGITEHARIWPGRIVVVSPSAQQSSDEYDVIRTDDVSATLRSERFDVVGALLRPEYAYVAEIAPTVYTAEVDRRIRTDLMASRAASRFDRARIAVGQVRIDRTYRSMARRAAGLHCNGRQAWKSYGRLNSRSLQVVDHRIFASDLAAAREREVWSGDRPLRVAFSGRLVREKGADTVAEVARRLPQIDFVMLGTGELHDRLAAEAPANLTLLGFVPFSEWKQYVRDTVDVALLPHPQGDPSCTYFEMLGSGVPVVGLRNSMWGPLAEEGLGWAERDLGALVQRIAQLRPADVRLARERGLDRVEPFEEMVATRVAHLVGIARDSSIPR